MEEILVVLGTAHSESTLGKGSPDGSLREYAYSREICQRIKSELILRGIKCVIDIEGPEEGSLANRCNIVNRYCAQYGAKNCIYVSVHLNASTKGGVWGTASGFSIYVYTGASENSKTLAKLICEEALKRNMKGNRFVPSCKYWTANFTMLKNTKCPAVLSENMFQDNKNDVAFLKSEAGKKAIVDAHVEGIINYIKGKK